ASAPTDSTRALTALPVAAVAPFPAEAARARRRAAVPRSCSAAIPSAYATRGSRPADVGPPPGFANPRLPIGTFRAPHTDITRPGQREAGSSWFAPPPSIPATTRG